MQSDTQKTGKQKIRAFLLEPLELLGLSRPKGMLAGQFEKALQGFENNLGYMDEEPITRLRLIIESNLEGKNKNIWPAPASVYDWARRCQKEPDEEPKLVVSWLQSKEGPLAIDGGYIVELRSDIRKYRMPPDEFALRMIKKRAVSNRHKLKVIEERAAVDRATKDELDWSASYLKTLQYCKDIVAAKPCRETEGK